MARADLIRHQLFLPRALSERLAVLAREPGVSRSKILGDALAAFLENKGDDGLERRFAARLDRMSDQLARIERNGRIDLESLAIFVRYMLTVSAPPSDEDKAAHAIGRDRFRRFVEQVGRQVAGGRLALVPEDDR